MTARLIGFAGVFALFASQALAGDSTPYRMGGNLNQFEAAIAQHSGDDKFRIIGHCQSACTMFLSMRNACVEPSATLLFHAGKDRSGQIAPGRSAQMMGHYNAALRAYLEAHHAMDTLAFFRISGSDIIRKFGYRRC